MHRFIGAGIDTMGWLVCPQGSLIVLGVAFGWAATSCCAFLPGFSRIASVTIPYGVVAQLVERCVRNAEVRGSTPLDSTSFRRPRSWLAGGVTYCGDARGYRLISKAAQGVLMRPIIILCGVVGLSTGAYFYCLLAGN